MNMERIGGLLMLVLIAGLILLVSGACAPEEPVARSYSCAVYTEQGCAKFVVANGGVVEVQSGGGFQITPGATVAIGAAISYDGINTFNNAIKVAAPTAIATATPAMVVDSLGVSNIFEVRDAATPVFRVENGGAVRGTYWSVSFEACDTALTASQDPIFTFQMPFAATLVEASATIRDIDVANTDETYVFALEDDGSPITSAWAVTADNTVALATINTAAVADNSKMEVTLTLGGTTPSAEDCYVLLTFTVQ